LWGGVNVGDVALELVAVLEVDVFVGGGVKAIGLISISVWCFLNPKTY
jgi:hypothetical protein